MSIENPSLLYVEQSLTSTQKARALANIGAQAAEVGKGLSTNDFDNAALGTLQSLNQKVQGIESGAEVNVIDEITVNGTAVTPTGKTVALTIPSSITVDQTYNGSSTNPQSGIAVAQALSGTGQVPTVTSNDDGKVLKASYDSATSQGSFRWDSAPSGVPSTTSSDEGKVLGVTNSTGTLGWVSQTPAAHDSTVTVKTGDSTPVTLGSFTTDQSSNSDITIPLAVPTGTGEKSGLMSAADKAKLDGIATGAQVNVKPNWNATAGAADEILNKPTLSTVATSGSYNDLTDKPTIPSIPVTDVQVDGSSVVNASGVAEITLPTFTQTQADWNQATTTAVDYIKNKPDLSVYALNSSLKTVATSGDYDDLINKPTIPAAQVNADWNASSGVAEILHKPDLSVYAQSSSLSTVATSGDYDDLLNTPTIPTVDQTYDGTSTNAQSGTAVASAISGLSFDEVPAVTSSDDGKVLKASYSGGAGSYSWQPESGGGSTYTAGDGIAIDSSNNISVKIPSSSAGLEFNSGVLDVKTNTAKGIQKGASGLEVRLANSSGLELSSGLKVKTDGSTIQVNSSGELVANGGGGTTYTAGDGIDISAQDEISAKVDGSSITVNANHELTTSAEANVIEGVKLDGAASVITPDASKNVTIPNAVATGESGATNGLMSADDKKALGTAVQYKVNPQESGTHVLLAQQIYVVESDAQIVAIANNASEINGKGTLFFRIGTAVT